MGNTSVFVLCALAGYLLGSVSFSILITNLVAKKDIRSLGSGNAGMTNVLRTQGKLAGVATFLGDFFKGYAAVLLARWLVGTFAAAGQGGGANLTMAMYIATLGAVLGHFYPLYFGFKGGKGVAVTCGAILGINLPVIAAMGLLFLALVLVFKIVSLSSIGIMLAFPVLTFFYNRYMGRPVMPATAFAALIGAMVIAKHHSNIKRLLKGEEYRFGQKNKLK